MPLRCLYSRQTNYRVRFTLPCSRLFLNLFSLDFHFRCSLSNRASASPLFYFQCLVLSDLFPFCFLLSLVSCCLAPIRVELKFRSLFCLLHHHLTCCFGWSLNNLPYKIKFITKFITRSARPVIYLSFLVFLVGEKCMEEWEKKYMKEEEEKKIEINRRSWYRSKKGCISFIR